MGVYSYSQSKVIDKVTIKRGEGGHVRAYLHAADGLDEAKIKEMLAFFEQKGWHCTPYNLAGAPVVQVEGISSEPKFIHLMEEKGWLTGASTYKKSKEDHISFGEAVKKRSLAASGVFYLIGDVAFMTYGYKGADKLNMAAGALYGAGTVSLLTFGRKDQSDLQTREIAKQLSHYMKEQGASISKECSLDAILHDADRGLIKKADDVLRRYPSELMNLFYAGAGACIAKSAYNHSKKPLSKEDVDDVMKRKLSGLNEHLPTTNFSAADKAAMRAQTEKTMGKMHKLEGQLDIGLGGMTGLSGLFAMLVKEKAHDPDAEPKKGLAGVKETIQHKPLAIAGFGYMISTLCHAVSTVIAWNNATTERRDSVPFRGIFVAANLVAEVLLAISSKGHGSGVKSDTSVDDTLIAMAAEVIVKQPARMQSLVIQQVSQFLGRPDTLALKDHEVAEKLTRQVELMRNNPWARVAGQQAVVSQPASELPPAEVPAAEQPQEKSQKSHAVKPLIHAAGREVPSIPGWGAKMAAREKALLPPGLGS